MDQNYATFLGFTISFVAFFSFRAVASWVNARRREREAFYRTEAVKKVAEMQGTVPPAVLELLREALTPRPESPHPQWLAATREYRREREAYYKSETLKKIAEMQGAGAGSLLEYLREEERNDARRRREGVKLGGFITVSVGVALVVVLRAMDTERPVYLVGLIPAFVGVVLLAYAYVMAPNDSSGRPS